MRKSITELIQQQFDQQYAFEMALYHLGCSGTEAERVALLPHDNEERRRWEALVAFALGE